MSTTSDRPVLEVLGARKVFGSVEALRGVDLTVYEREVVALLGDNGAGKSTLIKGISGAYALDGGSIKFDGKTVAPRSAQDARRLGIETVYQDLGMFDNLTAVENFFAGRELTRGNLGPLSLLDKRQMRMRWEEQAASLGLAIQSGTQEVGLMSGGQRQMIAVARAVSFASKLVILDEPTAALSVRATNEVLELVRRLPEQGISVILISHSLEQVERVADRAVVLYQGRTVGEGPPSSSNHEQLVALMMGSTAETNGAPGP